MSRLVGTIGRAARAEFGSRLALVSDAPADVIRTLAFDDAIEVAAPVLAFSGRLEDAALVENARTKSQGHLRAISGRSSVAEAVTDILVKRGNHQVVAGAAANPGARFSTTGMSILVKRAQDNGDLALCVWARPRSANGDGKWAAGPRRCAARRASTAPLPGPGFASAGSRQYGVRYALTRLSQLS